MGLLNFVGATAAGAGKGYGDGKAAVGALTLENLIKEAQMMKEDNLARLRQNDQNTFTAELSRLTREQQDRQHGDELTARTSEAMETRLQNLNEKKMGIAADKEAATLAYERDMKKLKFQAEHDKSIAGLKGDKAEKGDGFTDLPSDLEKYFLAPVKDAQGVPLTDPDGKPVSTFDRGMYADFIRFREVSGERDPRRAFAMWTSTKEAMGVNGANQGNPAEGLKGLKSAHGIGTPKEEKPKPAAKVASAPAPAPAKAPDTSGMISELNAGRGLDKTLFGKPVFARYSREQVMSVWDKLRPDVQQAYDAWWNQKTERPKGLLSGANPYSRNSGR